MRFNLSRIGTWFNIIIFGSQVLFLSLSPVLNSEAAENVVSFSRSMPTLKGLQILPSDGLTIKFYFQHSDDSLSNDGIGRVARIFLSGVTLDVKDLWVNLSPYEKDRVMSPLLAVTELGEIMAQQDYLLKKRAAILTHPDSRSGQNYWSSILKPARSLSAEKTLTKVWIVPESVNVYNLGDSAILGDMHLKVMVEKDYLALKQEGSSVTNPSQDDVNVTRDIICPILEKEVNESNEFAPLRQIFQTLVLAHWFKTYHADRIVDLDYIQSAKIKGIDLGDYRTIEGIYGDYYKMYKKGVYNLIREENLSGELTPRKYFAGGLVFDPTTIRFLNPGLDLMSNRFSGEKLDAATLVFAALISAPLAVPAAQDNPVIVNENVTQTDQWDQYLGKPKIPKQPPEIQKPKDKGYSFSTTSELGYLLGTKGGFLGDLDFQVGKKEAQAGEFSLYGGLHLNAMTQYVMNLSDQNMMGGHVNKSMEWDASPYLGVHRPGSEFDVYFEAQDFKNTRFGFESRPVYDQGWNYFYGLSGLVYESVEGYQAGLMADGYLSFKLAKVFPGNIDLLQRTYLTYTLKLLYSPEGPRIGGSVKLTYNDRWQLLAEISALKDSPIISEAIGHQYDLYKTRLGIAYRMSQNLELFGQWVEPMGHMTEEPHHFMLGFRWSFGKPSVIHDSRNRPVDFLRDSGEEKTPAPEAPALVNPPIVLPQKDSSSSSIINSEVDPQRRRLLKGMTASVLLVGSRTGALAYGNDFFDELYKVNPKSFSVCGEPLLILSEGDPLRLAHIIYMSFMYWYLNDRTNDGVSYEDPQKQYFSTMSVWEWEEFLKERKVTKRHGDLVRIVQKKMLAELQSAGILSQIVQNNDNFEIDGKLFARKFREWLDRWVIKLVYVSKENRVDLFPDLSSGEIRDIPPIEKEKRNQIKLFLNRFVTGDDVIAAMKLKGQDTGSDLLDFLRSRYTEFFNSNPQWIIIAAQVKLNSMGYQIPVDGVINAEMVIVIRKEIETSLKISSASSALTPGGIDFRSLPQVTSWFDMPEHTKDETKRVVRKDVVGMTFKVLDIKQLDRIDFIKD